MQTQYYVRKQENGAKTEPQVFSLPFVYEDTSYGVNISFDELKAAGFVKYVPTNLEVPALKMLDYVEYKELNDDEATFSVKIRDLNEAEFENYFGTKPSLEAVKSTYIKAFNEVANKAYSEYLSNYPDLEQSTFSQKANEAFKVMENEDTPLSDTPFLANLAGKNLQARNALAKAVNEKVAYITGLESFCVLKRDEIKAASNLDELRNIVIDLSDLPK